MQLAKAIVYAHLVRRDTIRPTSILELAIRVRQDITRTRLGSQGARIVLLESMPTAQAGASAPCANQGIMNPWQMGQAVWRHKQATCPTMVVQVYNHVELALTPT